jgi:hypothetical protein
MHFHLPIEQLVRRTDTRFQLGFATEAKEHILDRHEFLLEPSQRGLRVLAENEDALATPLETLRDVYGERLEVAPPRVRLMDGVQIKEPIMNVRISLENRFRERVKDALTWIAVATAKAHCRNRQALDPVESLCSGNARPWWESCMSRLASGRAQI